VKKWQCCNLTHATVSCFLSNVPFNVSLPKLGRNWSILDKLWLKLLWNCLVFKRRWWAKKIQSNWRRKRIWKRSRSRKQCDSRQACGLSTAHNGQLTGLSSTHNRKETRLRFLTGTCRPVLGPVDNQRPTIGFRFSFQACLAFLSGGLWIELKFYSLKDVIVKIEGFRIVLD